LDAAQDSRRGFSGSVRVFYPKFTQEEVFERIKEVASSLEGDLGLLKVTLFGSYATGRYTVASDIDILIVYDEARCNGERVYRELLKGLRLPRVELHILTRNEYEQLRGSRWIDVIEREGKEALSSL
jgi:predicted nucleotidyltransferase